MRPRTLAIAAALLGATAAITGLTLGHATAAQHQPAAQHSTAQQSPAARAAPAATAVPSPIAPGSEIYAGVPATVTLTGADGRSGYLEADPGELTRLSPGDAAALVASLPSLPAGTQVYEAPITITAPSGTLHLNAATLNAFTIATQPGADPLTSDDTLTTAGCPGLPKTMLTVHEDQSLTWCIHGFRTPGGAAPIGTQFQTPAGGYTGAVVWASHNQAGGPSIP